MVTGAASGIGLATARHLAHLGMKVCLADLPGANLDASAEEMKSIGSAVFPVATDVADAAQLRDLAARVARELDPVNVLMNNAGIQPGSGTFDSEGNWDRILAVNMSGIIRGSQIFAPAIIAHGQPA